MTCIVKFPNSKIPNFRNQPQQPDDLKTAWKIQGWLGQEGGSIIVLSEGNIWMTNQYNSMLLPL